MPHTSGPWEVTTLEGHLDDWTGARFVIRAPGAPGGIAVIMGGLGEEEEFANVRLITFAPILLDMLRDLTMALNSARLVMDQDSRDIAGSVVKSSRSVIAMIEKGGGR